MEQAERTAVVVGNGARATERLDSMLRAGGVIVVERAEDLRAAATLVQRRRPDLLVAASSSNHLDWLREARAVAPSTRVIVVGSSRDPERIKDAFRAGVTAYVVGMAEDDLAVAIRQSFERSMYLEPHGPAADGRAPARRRPDG